LQLANIRLAARQWRNTAAAHHLAIIFNHPVGMAWLAVKLKQLVQIRIGNGIAFVGGQAVFRRDGTDNGGNSRVVAGGYPAECRKDCVEFILLLNRKTIHHSDI
jgi:hypothetical protein